ncbi:MULTISPECIES: TrbC/VirB2 family protein [Roseobacteraceae]|jgi:type IV secretion system protein VirB2|uniref:TrbC/VIRB2 family protein n=1 Tax=Pseudosulfitobacter pseudonitzschiae TaxID=1402135 RepID=A0A221K7Y8_9RHOB|nr:MULTISPECIES: TrbC/VirB2 family protein [Roseobacteraceae]ASM75096.1 TrbC/VIRB2 family protein [Pseudosulfitobacter pseudonitzschiae]
MKSIAAFTNRLGAPASIALVLLLGFSGPAAAAGFTDFLNNVVNEFNSARRPLALIAVMIVGALYMFNVMDMRRTGQVIVGIIIIFAAGEILDLITG